MGEGREGGGTKLVIGLFLLATGYGFKVIDHSQHICLLANLLTLRVPVPIHLCMVLGCVQYLRIRFPT